MAEEVQNSSLPGESNKRKFNDSPPPPASLPLRASGFSSPPVSATTPGSNDSITPPMSDIVSAKQIEASVNVDPLKRVKLEENGEGGGRGESSPKAMGSGFSDQPQYTSSGLSGKIEIPGGEVGVIIGKCGDYIKCLQQQSGAKNQVTGEAEQLKNETLSEADVEGTGSVSRRMSGQEAGSEKFVKKVANNKVGIVVGKRGEPIKRKQKKNRAGIQVIPPHLPPSDMSKERTVQIDGTSQQIEAARQLVEEVTSENQPRNSSMSGGYPQQGYQAQPQNNYGYAPPGPPVSQIQSAANQNYPRQSVYAGYGQTQKPPSGQPAYGQPGYAQSAETSQRPPKSYPVSSQTVYTVYGGVQPQQFKNFLQQFTGKNHFHPPVYTTRTKGPRHSQRFKSSVSVNGKSYGTANFFPTLKEAQQAAAKVACQELLVGAIQEDGGLHKNLLRELAREKGLKCPTYECIKSGLQHMPLFAYTVEIGSRIIQGAEARTKKLAEMHAARAAYYALMESN